MVIARTETRTVKRARAKFPGTLLDKRTFSRRVARKRCSEFTTVHPSTNDHAVRMNHPRCEKERGKSVAKNRWRMTLAEETLPRERLPGVPFHRRAREHTARLHRWREIIYDRITDNTSKQAEPFAGVARILALYAIIDGASSSIARLHAIPIVDRCASEAALVLKFLRNISGGNSGLSLGTFYRDGIVAALCNRCNRSKPRIAFWACARARIAHRLLCDLLDRIAGDPPVK